MGGFAQWGADGVAIHRRHRQAQAQRWQQRGRCRAGAQHDGVKTPHVALALHHHADWGGSDAIDAGVEGEVHARALCALAQQLCKQAAVASAGVGQVNGPCQRRLGRQAGLDLARDVGIDFAQGHTAVAQHLQCGLELGALLLCAQQYQAPLAGLKVEFVPLGQGLQAALAVLRQALQRGCWGAAGVCGAAPAAQPGPVGAAQPARQPQRGVWPHQPQGVAESGHGPGAEQVGGEQAGRGKAGFFGGGAALFKNGDFVAVAGQLVRGGDADNPGAHDGNLHEIWMFLASCA